MVTRGASLPSLPSRPFLPSLPSRPFMPSLPAGPCLPAGPGTRTCFVTVLVLLTVLVSVTVRSSLTTLPPVTTNLQPLMNVVRGLAPTTVALTWIFLPPLVQDLFTTRRLDLPFLTARFFLGTVCLLWIFFTGGFAETEVC